MHRTPAYLSFNSEPFTSGEMNFYLSIFFFWKHLIANYVYNIRYSIFSS